MRIRITRIIEVWIGWRKILGKKTLNFFFNEKTEKKIPSSFICLPLLAVALLMPSQQRRLIEVNCSPAIKDLQDRYPYRLNPIIGSDQF